jgi:uncharacterized protein (TIGR03437 family)
MGTHIPRTTFPKVVLGLCLCCVGAPAQVITTVAGTDFFFPSTPLPALSAPLGNTQGVAIDAQGNVYAADSGNNIVVRISPNGALTVVAGNGIQGFSGDGGPATSASLNFLSLAGIMPAGAVAVDSAGNLYIADTWNYRIRKVSGGTITTVAGGGNGPLGDGGPATNASLSLPEGVAVDSAGNLYIADAVNNRIRKVSGGTITTVAGGGNGPLGDGGPATSASLAGPAGVAVDSAGNLYIADTYNGRIRKVSGGTITTVAGNGYWGLPCNGGPATSACLFEPAGVAVDSAGNLYIADTKDGYIRKVTGGTITTVAGNGNFGYSGDGGPATSASLYWPNGVVVDSAGNLYIADTSNNRIRKVSGGTITTAAGNGAYRYSGDGGPATSASLNQPTDVAVDSAGNLYIADGVNNRIRKVSGGTITTVAGNDSQGFSGDGGPATSALLSMPSGVAVDPAGNLYIADSWNDRIREVSGGTITTVAGNENNGFSGDGGPATRAWLNDPQGVAVDSAGNLYIADTDNNRIRKVSGGTITTVAGSENWGFSGDGGPATSASLNWPSGVAVDSAGNLYIADTENSLIREVSGGTITTVAGNENLDFSGDGGPATSASLCYPSGVAVDSAGNFYIADTCNEQIRKVSGGTITTVAGNGPYDGFSGDGGPATSALLNMPSGVAVDSAGNLYIADTDNNRIREVLATKPAVLVSPASLTFSAQSTGAPAPTQSFSIASVPGLAFSLTVATTDGGNWLSVTPQSGAAPRLINVVADPSTLTSPGTYQGTITIATPDGNPPATTINVRFQVSPAQPAALAPLDPRSLSFAFAKSTPAQSQRLTISNAGGGALSFTAAASITTPAGARWLTLSQASGQALPSSPAILTVTADPTGLGAGTFTGTVSVTAGSTTLSVPVTMTVSALDQAILLSQRGLFFTAMAQGGVIPPQTFAVLNIGTGVVAWTAKATPIPATPVWFSVSPTSGSTDAAQSPPVVAVNVDPSKLAVAGTYYGLVEVDAPTAANSPQVLTVVLQLLPAGADTGAALAPGSLLFTTTAGRSSPGSQNVQVYNITAKAKSFRSVVSADPGLSIVTLPTDATLDPQNPTSIVVQPLTTALGPGVYTGVVTLEFDDGRVIRLTVKVIATKTGGISSAGISRSNALFDNPADATGCAPTKLQPILTAPNEAFNSLTGYGVKLGVFVEDDCGVPLESGSVKVSFSNGDTTSTLQPLQGGLWEGTWYTQNPSPSVNLMVHAVNPQGISGDLQTNGTLASQTPPAFDAGGIISVFGGANFAPLAPGEVISIYGSGLAEAAVTADPPPLLTTLKNTTVFIQSTSLPLYYVSDTQVNAVVPYSLGNNSLNAPLQILVKRGDTISQPVYVTVATAEPTIYGGPGGITDYPSDYPASPPYTVSASTPAHAGDIIVLYCLGLGAVSPPVADGGLPTGLSWAAPIQMMIGDQAATVLFQGLTPQFPGIYQVNAVIPAGVTAGSSVPVTISSGGQTSPPIQIPIQ